MKLMVLTLLTLTVAACGALKGIETPRVSDASQVGGAYAERCEETAESRQAQSTSSFVASGINLTPFRAVARLRMSTAANCSAVLIAPDRLISAAHCFEKNTSASLAEFIDSTIDRDPANHEEVAITKITLHPEYAAAQRKGLTLATRPDLSNVDFAILTLARPVTDRKSVSLTSKASIDALMSGKLVGLVGYGDTGLGAGTKRFAQSHVGKVVAQKSFGPVVFRNLLTLDSLTGTGACPGDSGGGVFLKEGENYTLLGVVSGINTFLYPGFPIDTCTRCPNGLGVIALASPQADFIAR